MRKIKVFISQAMKGLSDEKIKENRDKLFNRFKSSVIKYSKEPIEVELIDSFIDEDPPKGVNIPVWYLSKSLEKLATADVLVAEFSAVHSSGCSIELRTVNVYDIPRIIIKPVNILMRKDDTERVLNDILEYQESEDYPKE